jgi:hypothetical protein
MHPDFAALVLAKFDHEAVLEHEYYAIVIRERGENLPPNREVTYQDKPSPSKFQTLLEHYLENCIRLKSLKTL